MDFVVDALASGCRIKCLTCVDDFTNKCMTIIAAVGSSGRTYSEQRRAASKLSGNDESRP